MFAVSGSTLAKFARKHIEELPPDWQMAVSRTTGETYFVNMVTGESTFERPGGGSLRTLMHAVGCENMLELDEETIVECMLVMGLVKAYTPDLEYSTPPEKAEDETEMDATTAVNEAKVEAVTALELDTEPNPVVVLLPQLAPEQLQPEPEIDPVGCWPECSEAQHLKSEGNVHFKNGAIEAAILSYTEAIRVLPSDDHPDASTFYSNRAACHNNLGAYDAVVADCTRALSINPENWKAQMRRGYALEALEKFQLALEDLRAVAHRDQEARFAADRLARRMVGLDEVSAAHTASACAATLVAEATAPATSSLSASEPEPEPGLLPEPELLPESDPQPFLHAVSVAEPESTHLVKGTRTRLESASLSPRQQYARLATELEPEPMVQPSPSHSMRQTRTRLKPTKRPNDSSSPPQPLAASLDSHIAPQDVVAQTAFHTLREPALELEPDCTPSTEDIRLATLTAAEREAAAIVSSAKVEAARVTAAQMIAAQVATEEVQAMRAAAATALAEQQKMGQLAAEEAAALVSEATARRKEATASATAFLSQMRQIQETSKSSPPPQLISESTAQMSLDDQQHASATAAPATSGSLGRQSKPRSVYARRSRVQEPNLMGSQKSASARGAQIFSASPLNNTTPPTRHISRARVGAISSPTMPSSHSSSMPRNNSVPRLDSFVVPLHAVGRTRSSQISDSSAWWTPPTAGEISVKLVQSEGLISHGETSSPYINFHCHNSAGAMFPSLVLLHRLLVVSLLL